MNAIGTFMMLNLVWNSSSPLENAHSKIALSDINEVE